MKAQLESTSKIITVNGIEARVWEGLTENGIRFHAFIVRVGVEKTSDLSQFEAELKETRPPSPEVAAYPARMIL